jgi:hypothetical protein
LTRRTKRSALVSITVERISSVRHVDP